MPLYIFYRLSFITEDSVEGNITNPLSQNLYTYVENNPTKYVDPTGHILETAFDVGSAIYSGYQLYEKPSWENAGYLAWDVGAVLVPVVPASGTVKIIKSADKIVDTVKGAGKAQSLLTAGTKADALKFVDDLPTNVQRSVKSFFKGGSNKYTDFTVEQLPNGTYMTKMTKPGDVPGSKAIYYKEISPDGTTIKVYKDTFDPAGKLVHTKQK